MIRFWPLLTGAVILGCASGLYAQENLTHDQMDDDLRELLGVIRRDYAYLEEKKEVGVVPDKLLANGLKRLDGVKSDADFANVLKEATAGLKDGHCEVYAGRLAAPKPNSWPFLLAFVKEGVLVVGIHPSLAGGKIDRGDLVREVNGRPVEDWIADAARTVSASTVGARRRLALQRVTATADESVDVKAEHVDRTFSTMTLWTCPPMRNPVEPTPQGLPDEGFSSARVLEGGVGYIRIPSFAWETADYNGAKTDADRDAATKPARDQIDAAFGKAADAKGLILDLRGNGGGRDLLGAYVLSHFVPGDFCYYTTQTRSSPELRRVGGFANLPAEDGWTPKYGWEPRKTGFTFFKGKPYAGRLVVLINETCFSATDCLAAALADLYPDVRFVGRPTNGGAGGPMVVARLKHSQADVQLCVMKVWSPKGRLIEGHGISPDVAVQWTREDVLTGRDADLEAALKDLQR